MAVKRYDIVVRVETGVANLPAFWATVNAYGHSLTESEVRIALAQCRTLMPDLFFNKKVAA